MVASMCKNVCKDTHCSIIYNSKKKNQTENQLISMHFVTFM